MRRKRTLLAAGICSIALLGVAILPAATSSAQASAPTAAPAQTEAEAAAQCAKAPASRVGPWSCGDKVVQTDPQRKAAVLAGVAAGKLTASSEAVALSTGTCTTAGCWTNFTSTRSNFVGHGYYGYGSTSLGRFDMLFEVNVSGFATKSLPFYAYTSRGTKSFNLSGNRLYLSTNYPAGNPVNGGGTYRSFACGARAAGITCKFGTAGYGSYENTASKITIAHEASWTDPSSAYPGRWYFYAKSIQMDWTTAGYRNHGTTLPMTPSLAGWKPV